MGAEEAVAVPTGSVGVSSEAYYLIFVLPPAKSPLFELSLYEETNGLPGLQRGDEMLRSRPAATPTTIIY